MRIFLAGTAPWMDLGIYNSAIEKYAPFILESYFDIDKALTLRLLPLFGDFMMDSGAFTFMQNSNRRVDWERYIDEYAEFVKTAKIEKYIELDIDNVVGYKQVLKYRERLERRVGWPSIPVWHKIRGKGEFVRMVKEARYCAIGGIVSKEITPEQYKYSPWFIDKAHEHGAKLHGLGFTRLNALPKYHFDSVDSTAWTCGNRFGFIYRFNGQTMVKVKAPVGTRLKDSRAAAVNNFVEWCKYQQWADKYL